MELLNKLRVLASEYYTNNNEEKYLIIKELLSDDRCFFLMSSTVALSILSDLGFEDSEALEMYEELISSDNYQKNYEIVKVK